MPDAYQPKHRKDPEPVPPAETKVCSRYGNRHDRMGLGVCTECGYSTL